MSSPKTTMAPPVHLSLPPTQPEPAPGCDVCAALKRQREQARAAGDLSGVSDCNVEIARHHRNAPN